MILLQVVKGLVSRLITGGELVVLARHGGFVRSLRSHLR